MLKNKKSKIVLAVLVVLITLHISASVINKTMMHNYADLASKVVYDRNGDVVNVSLNKDEQVCLFSTEYSEHVIRLVLKKEDQWFYYHPGINFYRTARSAALRIFNIKSGGASTITQQLAKSLLDNTSERTYVNKLQELFIAFVLEYKHSKDDILRMYLNTAPLGGNIQGFPAAARAYFNKQVAELNENETLQLVSALSNPNYAKPLSETNLSHALLLSNALDATAPTQYESEVTYENAVWLELTDILKGCDGCRTSLDVELTERIRSILRNYVEDGASNNITHGAVAVIDIKTNELVALVGSPDPNSSKDGMRINMALQTRPIGSTIKPFLYLLGFSKGLRPYTLVDDREYKFTVDAGFPIYPKNYDGQYRGIVTLEESLANSLNVPSVEVLRYSTLEHTYNYLEHTLGFAPEQDWSEYSYGIALGGLELDLLTLTHAFTALANKGSLSPLVSGHHDDGQPFYFIPPHSILTDHRQIMPEKYIALLNTILTDRTAGVEQFGQSGSLFLSRPNYAVKTGTSRDYHDSWTVGYTADYVVGVWIGNVKNTPMNKVSGSTGAGKVWHDVMELMFTTPYFTEEYIDVSSLVHVENERGYSYGLPDDDVETLKNLLIDDTLILSPHNGDTYFLTEGMCIPLKSSKEVEWIIDGSAHIENTWCPKSKGVYSIRAYTEDDSFEELQVSIVEDTTISPQ